MTDWNSMKLPPPENVEVLVKLSNGVETNAIRVGPPPIEIDPEQTFGGWMVDVSGDWTDLDYTIDGWRHHDRARTAQ